MSAAWKERAVDRIDRATNGAAFDQALVDEQIRTNDLALKLAFVTRPSTLHAYWTLDSEAAIGSNSRAIA